MIHDITIKQNKVIVTATMDGSYDSNNNFQFLSFRGIQPAIEVRKNARYRKKINNDHRNKNVQLRKTNLEQWKNSVSYGQR